MTVVRPVTAGFDTFDDDLLEAGSVAAALEHAKANPGFPMGPWKRAELFDLYERYWRYGLSLRELVEPLWQEKGYRKPAGAEGTVRQAWKRNGWRVRSRGATKRLATIRHGRKKWLPKRIPVDDLRKMHVLHAKRGVSINEICKATYERYGYSSAKNMTSAVSVAWKSLGLPARDRIDMTVAKSTKHGLKRRRGSSSAVYKRYRAQQKGEQYDAPCTATNQRGNPCQARAMLGRDVCQFHAPERQEALAAHVEAMRARSPLHDPARLEPLGPLQIELRACFEQLGSWKLLAGELGVKPAWLSRLSRTTQQQRIAKLEARRIRAAIERLTPIETRRAA